MGPKTLICVFGTQRSRAFLGFFSYFLSLSVEAPLYFSFQHFFGKWKFNKFWSFRHLGQDFQLDCVFFGGKQPKRWWVFHEKHFFVRFFSRNFFCRCKTNSMCKMVWEIIKIYIFLVFLLFFFLWNIVLCFFFLLLFRISC